jgi:hypothetical protein
MVNRAVTARERVAPDPADTLAGLLGLDEADKSRPPIELAPSERNRFLRPNRRDYQKQSTEQTECFGYGCY